MTGKHPGVEERDFLGPDIDIGFRISRFSLRKRLVVSAHLAALIYHEARLHEGIDEHFRIVSYEKLKGAWSDRHYPIVWFEDSWTGIKQSFLYDELIVSDLAKRAVEVAESRGEFGVSAVQKVFRDLDKEEEIARLQRALDELPEQEEEVEIGIPISRYAEVHCVAVCFTQSGKVLTAKRPKTKRRFPCALEFGCGQLKLGESFADCLRRAYKDDFGVEIRIPDNPIPVSSYIIEDTAEGRAIPGIIFVAEIDDDAAVEANFARHKHDEIQWLDATAPLSLEIEAVPNLADNIRKAYELWKKRREA